MVLLDLAMPGMDGWQFLERQSKGPRAGRAPVVLMSGLPFIRDAPGVADFIRKPIEAARLLDCVSRFCGEPEPTQPRRMRKALPDGIRELGGARIRSGRRTAEQPARYLAVISRCPQRFSEADSLSCSQKERSSRRETVWTRAAVTPGRPGTRAPRRRRSPEGLYSSVPRSSQCPSTSSRVEGYFFSQPASVLSASRASTTGRPVVIEERVLQVPCG